MVEVEEITTDLPKLPKREKQIFDDIIEITCKEIKGGRIGWDKCELKDSKGAIKTIRGVNSILTDRHKINRLVSDDKLFHVRFLEPHKIKLYLIHDSLIDLSPSTLKNIMKLKPESRKKVAERSTFQTYVKKYKDIP